MSSLANQLKAVKASNNASTVLDKKKKKKIHSVSLVFEANVAADQQWEIIYYYSLDALRELEVIDPRFEQFENSLFAESSIQIDRLVQVCC